MKTFTTFFSLLIITTIFQNKSIAQSWTSKASLPANELQSAAAFSIGDKGYIVTGTTFSGTGSDKLWEYNQSIDSWTAKSNFPGAARNYAVAFSIGTKGYVGTGQSTAGPIMNDFWEWDQASDTWNQKANFAGTPRKFAVGFSIDSLGYIGGGWDNSGIGGTIKGDVWEFSPTANSWTAKAALPTARYGASSFTIGSKGYVSGGDIGSGLNFYTDLLEYDPALNTWTPKASLPSTNGEQGRGRNLAFAFSIGSKGYIGTGVYIPTAGGLPAYCSDFWEWDQASDTWTMRTSFPGGNRQWTVGFGLGNFGYAGTGERAGVSYNDIWEWGNGAAGIENNLIADDVSIFPNPSSGVFRLQFSDSRKLTGMKVFNCNGELVYKPKEIDKLQIIDLSSLSNGIYYFQITMSNQDIITKKLTIIN